MSNCGFCRFLINAELVEKCINSISFGRKNGKSMSLDGISSSLQGVRLLEIGTILNILQVGLLVESLNLS